MAYPPSSAAFVCDMAVSREDFAGACRQQEGPDRYSSVVPGFCYAAPRLHARYVIAKLLCPLCQRRGGRRRSACAALQLIDAQRRQDEWTTVDPAPIRGLATA